MTWLLLLLSVALLAVAVDLATRGPERRSIERRRRAVRRGIEVPAKLPRLRVVPKHARRDGR